MNRIIPILITVFIVMLTLISLYNEKFFVKSTEAFAIDGHLSLQEIDLKDSNILRLAGEWEFYPNQLITPEKDKDVFNQYEHARKKINVPGSWNDYVALEEQNPTVGTFRLIIDVPTDNSYAVKMNKILHASTLFLNGEKVGNNGIPSANLDEYHANTTMYTSSAFSKNGRIEIVVHVANFFYPTGGIIQAFEFGTSDSIYLYRDQKRALDAFLIAGYLLISFYFLSMFIQRKHEYYYALFCFYCFLQGIYFSTLNERLFNLFFPNLSIAIFTNIQMSLLHTSTILFLWASHLLFKEYSSRKITMLLTLLLVTDTVLVGIPNVNIFLFNVVSILTLQVLIIFIMCISNAYILVVLIKAFKNNKEASDRNLVVLTTYICYGLLQSFNSLFDLKFHYIPVFFFSIMVFYLAMHISFRYQKASLEAEKFAEDLQMHEQLKKEFIVKTVLELKRPIHNILAISQALVEGEIGPLRSKQQESIMLMQGVGKKLSRTVMDLEDATINQANQEVHPTSIPVNVIDEVLAEMKLIRPISSTVNIRNDIQGELPLLYVDEQRFKQIIHNLLDNAIKFTIQGEIVLSAKVVETDMHIKITDTGIGIEKEKLAYVFSAFGQVQNNFKRISNGLGLGLTIAKQLVELSGGEIWLDSIVGKGTQLTFSVPLTKYDMEHQQENEGLELMAATIQDSVNLQLPVKRKGTENFTILVVDDDHTNLQFILEIISSLNYTVIAVDSGEDALKIIQDTSVDLMIVDLIMPKISGYELSEKIRQEYSLIELPIILLTSSVQSATSMWGKGNAYVRKPIDPEKLKEKIVSLLLMKKSAQTAIHNELSYFNAQIAPHFLYNTLNSIIVLTYKDSGKARDALQHLTTYFRAKLDFFSSQLMVPLEQELELVKSYVAIEQMRFGEKLKVEFDIDEKVEVTLPSMSIQPLVENAINHGISKKSEHGTLCISVRNTGQGILIAIEDTGVGMSEEKKAALLNEKTGGIGFSNSFSRLKLIKNAKLKLESEEGRGTKITIFLPEMKNDASSFN